MGKKNPAKKLGKEFKDFITKGNVISLAIGVIIGGAFNKIVTSLVNDVVMPIFAVVTGQNDFSTLFLALDGNTYATAEEAGTVPLLKYGSFISTVLDFLLMGLVIFFLVKLLSFLQNKLTKEKPEPEPTVKKCPHCVSEINIEATVCPHCTRNVSNAEPLAQA